MSLVYKINTEGQTREEYVRKNFFQILIFVPTSFLFLTALVYISIAPISILYFYFMLAYILALFIFSFFSTLRMIRRQNRTISQIDILNDNIILKTNKILWLKSKELNSEKSQIRSEKRKYGWYGKKTIKEGLTIFTHAEELFLVKDYFDDYDTILNLLSPQAE